MRIVGRANGLLLRLFLGLFRFFLGNAIFFCTYPRLLLDFILLQS
jgi:hypothetical protein